MTKQQKQIILGVWLAFIMSLFVAVSPLHASPNYSFPPRENNPYVTMDVIKNGPGGGTYVCKDVVTCYQYVRYAEERGATRNCQSIIIKRNGYPVITRLYQ